MAKILFVPTNSREITQFSLVKPELEAMKHEVLAIALDAGKALDKSYETLGNVLIEKGFSYRPITDYQTRNVLKIIRAEKPDIILVDWSGFTPNAFIYAGNHLGIPCLFTDDGVFSSYFATRNKPPLRQSFLKMLKRAFRMITGKANPRPLLYLVVTLAAIYGPLLFLKRLAVELLKSTYRISSYTEGAYVATMSSFARDSHISMGAPPEKVFVTGQPRFDLIANKNFDRKRITAELGVPENRGIIVLATQPTAAFRTKKDRDIFIQTAVGAMSEFPEKQLVIKLHPGEIVDEYQSKSKLMEVNGTIVCQDIDLHELLSACELVVTAQSTVALEAMILQKPVITINLSGETDVMPYAEKGAALGVYRQEDLVPTIKKALCDEGIKENLARNREKFIAEHTYKVDGQAARRVAELIVRLAKDAKKKEGVLT